MPPELKKKQVPELNLELTGFGAVSDFLWDPHGYSRLGSPEADGADTPERQRGQLPELMLEQNDFKRIKLDCGTGVFPVYVWADQTADEAAAAHAWFVSLAHDESACYRHMRVWLTGGPWKPRTLPKRDRLACQTPVSVEAWIFKEAVDCKDSASPEQVLELTAASFHTCEEVHAARFCSKLAQPVCNASCGCPNPFSAVWAKFSSCPSPSALELSAAKFCHQNMCSGAAWSELQNQISMMIARRLEDSRNLKPLPWAETGLP